MNDETQEKVPDRSLLIVDDDAPLRGRLARAMEQRGFEVATAESVADGVETAAASPPAYAVVDLRLEDGNGLEVVEALRRVRPDIRVVMLTGYGNIASTVAAIKAGRWTTCLSPPTLMRFPRLF